MTYDRHVVGAPAEAMSRPEAGVRVRRLVRRFGANTVLDGLELDLRPGSFTALLGRSGSGKSTLLRTLAGLDAPPAEAELVVPSPVAVVFQEPRLLPWKRIWENVALGLPSRGLQGRDARDRAAAALREVGLERHLDAYPLTLSGGEAQRAALARALVRAPALLLLDEPFAALDALTRIRMHGLVTQLWRTHLPTTLLVTHDVDEAIQLADRALVLAEGRIAADVAIDLKRPRGPAQQRFAVLRQRLLSALGVDAPTDHEAGGGEATAQEEEAA
jgi:sulfonate transport system ATP-binding protein